MTQTLIIENSCDEEEVLYPSYTAITLDAQAVNFITTRVALVKRLQLTDKSLRRITYDFNGYGFSFDSNEDLESGFLESSVNSAHQSYWVIDGDEKIDGVEKADLDVFNIVIDEDSFFIRASGHHDDFYFESSLVELNVLSETPLQEKGVPFKQYTVLR